MVARMGYWIADPPIRTQVSTPSNPRVEDCLSRRLARANAYRSHLASGINFYEFRWGL